MGILLGRTGGDSGEKFAPASTFLELIQYDAVNQTMDITFRSGTKIRYLGTTPNTYLSFKSSPTHSAFYARLVKGNLQSVKIIDNSIGTNKSAPLKKVKREGTLDSGIERSEAREQRYWGTVDRAFNAAAVRST